MHRTPSREPLPTVIDIAPFFSGGAEERGRVAVQVGAACEAIGCFLITGHGVPRELIERVDRLWRAFFDEPLERKLACAPPDPGLFRGYYGIATSAIAYSQDKQAPPDLRELYFINRTHALPASYIERLGPAGAYLAHPNIWPASRRELREASEAFYASMLRVAEGLVAVYAVALDLPLDYFADKIDKHHSTFGAASYPAQSTPPLPGQQRCAAHSDFSVQTLLYQDDAPGGLQIQDRDGEWLDVPRRDGALVVNLGDTMAWWTNHRWRSPVHRVVNPPAAVAASSRRQSLLFFHAPNYDAELSCVPSCKGLDKSSEPPPLTVGELILRKSLKGTMAGA